MRTSLFSGYRGNGIAWFRILGKGLHVKDVSRNPLLFSERNGYAPALTIGRFRVRVLR